MCAYVCVCKDNRWLEIYTTQLTEIVTTHLHCSHTIHTHTFTLTMGSRSNQFRNVFLDFGIFFHFENFSIFPLFYCRSLLWPSSLEQLSFQNGKIPFIAKERPLLRSKIRKIVCNSIDRVHWIFKRNVIKSFDTSLLFTECIAQNNRFWASCQLTFCFQLR